jgi:hypothetical protein
MAAVLVAIGPSAATTSTNRASGTNAGGLG